MALRTCRTCGVVATTEEDLLLFSVSKLSKFGRENKCKTCSNTEQRTKYNQAEYTRLYREKNKDTLKPKQQAQGRSWSAANRHKRNASENKRRSIKNKCTVYNSEKENRKVQVIYRVATVLSKISVHKYHVDHIEPLSKGGSHIASNLQIVTSTFNLKKGNRSNDKYISINVKHIRKFCL